VPGPLWEQVAYEERDIVPGWYRCCGYPVAVVVLGGLTAMCVVVYRTAGPAGGWILIICTSLVILQAFVYDIPRHIVADHAGVVVRFSWLPVTVRLPWGEIACARVCNPWEVNTWGIVPLGPVWWDGRLRAWLLDCTFRWLLTARGSWHQRRRGVFIEMSSGRRFWVGSNHPEELLRAAEIGTGRSFTT